MNRTRGSPEEPCVFVGFAGISPIYPAQFITTPLHRNMNFLKMYYFKGSVSSVSLNNFGTQIRPWL